MSTTSPPPPDIPVNITSIFGAQLRKGLVNLEIGPHTITMEPTKAREIAAWLVECAEAAETDELLVRFFQDRIGLDDRRFVRLLSDFRRMREEFRERDRSRVAL